MLLEIEIPVRIRAHRDGRGIGDFLHTLYRFRVPVDMDVMRKIEVADSSSELPIMPTFA
jgi:hypothetical protein